MPVGGDVDLAAQEGFYAGVGSFFVELDHPVHHAVVGERDAGHVLILGERNEVPNATRPVEHRILRMAVQMRERRCRQLNSLSSFSKYREGLRRRQTLSAAFCLFSHPQREEL